MLAERHSQNCTAFLTVWMVSFSSRVSFHFFMIFCRQVVKHAFLFLKSWSRFTYVCYASGLLKEGLSLLHWLTMILMTLICINTTIIYPLRFILFSSTRSSECSPVGPSVCLCVTFMNSSPNLNSILNTPRSLLGVPQESLSSLNALQQYLSPLSAHSAGVMWIRGITCCKGSVNRLV